MMMMMMRRVMCVLAVVLCCACGYTMAGEAAADAGQPKAVMAFVDPFFSSTDLTGTEEIENIGRGQAKTTKSETPDNGRPDVGMSNFDMEHFPVVSQSDLEAEKKMKEKRKAEEIIKKGSYHPAQTDPVNEIYECAKKGLSYGVYGKNCSFMNASEKFVPVDNKEESQDTQNSENGTSTSGNDATDVPLPTEVSEGSDISSADTTTDTHTESPSATDNSSVPVTDREISKNASTVQKKGNGDSSLSPMWMRTAAPLLIVAVLVSITVY